MVCIPYNSPVHYIFFEAFWLCAVVHMQFIFMLHVFCAHTWTFNVIVIAPTLSFHKFFVSLCRRFLYNVQLFSHKTLHIGEWIQACGCLFFVGKCINGNFRRKSKNFTFACDYVETFAFNLRHFIRIYIYSAVKGKQEWHVRRTRSIHGVVTAAAAAAKKLWNGEKKLSLKTSNA